MKVNFNKKKLLFSITTILLIIFFISEVFSHIHKKSSNNSNNAKNQKSKSYSNKTSSNSKLNKTNSHNHNYNNIHLPKNSFLQNWVNKCFEFLESQMSGFSKEKQAYLGAFIVSSASIPVFLIIMIFNIQSLVILNTMSAFAAGALVGDVFLHNLPEIYDEDNHKIKVNFFARKETLLGLGLISLFVFEKIIKILLKNTTKVTDKKEEEKHSHSHSRIGHGNSENVILSILGDLIHNVTDGLAIGAAYATNLKLGITLTLSIFFHEIPHEVGDFSFLLKQKLSKFNAMSTQVFSAIGAFIGVYLNFVIGDSYSLHILSFASGTFLYLSINTILGDIKEATSILDVITEMIAFMLGFYLLFIII